MDHNLTYQYHTLTYNLRVVDKTIPHGTLRLFAIANAHARRCFVPAVSLMRIRRPGGNLNLMLALI